MKENRKQLVGKVVSDKMNKTRTVLVERRTRHATYGKIIKRISKFKIHDEKNSSKIGDIIRAIETRPLSKTKCWRLIEILEKSIVDELNDEALDNKEQPKA